MFVRFVNVRRWTIEYIYIYIFANCCLDVGFTYRFMKRFSGIEGISMFPILFLRVSTYGTSVVILPIQLLLA